MTLSQDVLIYVRQVQGGVPCHLTTVDLDVSYYKTEKPGAGA